MTRSSRRRTTDGEPTEEIDLRLSAYQVTEVPTVELRWPTGPCVVDGDGELSLELAPYRVTRLPGEIERHRRSA